MLQLSCFEKTLQFLLILLKGNTKKHYLKMTLAYPMKTAIERWLPNNKSMQHNEHLMFYLSSLKLETTLSPNQILKRFRMLNLLI